MAIHRHPLIQDSRGAVAPLTALSLIGLVAAGGLAFDYARMAGMDSELQSAADHAAVAAATQLDGKDGACARAARAAAALVANETRFANDGDGRGISVPLETACDATGSVRFYSTVGRTPATGDIDAHFVELWVDGRTARYALTPIVALLDSGDMQARAYAGLKTASCYVPPVMMCNPAEPIGNTNVYLGFDVESLAGHGIRLIGDGSFAPGNWGFVASGAGNGANDLRKALGWDVPPGGCSSTVSITTEPGQMSNVINALNTRFDIDENPNCPNGGTCSASVNVRKDLIRRNQCGLGGNGWHETSGQRYRPATAAPISAAQTPAFMGLPRDMCHAISLTGNCSGGHVGNGDWDRDAYFRANYGATFSWQSQLASVLKPGQSASSITRYQVYKWEIANPGVAGSIGTAQAIGSDAAYGQPVCRGTGITPGPAQPDRRRMLLPVINCQALGITGRRTVPVAAMADVFLVEPSAARTRCGSGTNCGDAMTRDNDLYVEVIGQADAQRQLVSRSQPYLIE